MEPRTALAGTSVPGKCPPSIPKRRPANSCSWATEWLTLAGYEHYEISNFALPGHRSRHNSSYWQGIPYLGLGPSAHSFDGHIRRWNVANNAAYLEASIATGVVPYEEEVLTQVQRLNEYIMTSLRTMEGLDRVKVERAWGRPARERLEKAALGFLAAGKMRQTADAWC